MNEYVIEHDPTLWSSTVALQIVSISLRFEHRLIPWLRFPWCFPVLFQDNFRTGKEFQLIAVESLSHRIPKMFTSLDTWRTSVNFYLRVVFPDIFVLEYRSYLLSRNDGDKLLLPQWNFRKNKVLLWVCTVLGLSDLLRKRSFLQRHTHTHTHTSLLSRHWSTGCAVSEYWRWIKENRVTLQLSLLTD